jgi:glutaredoxin
MKKFSVAIGFITLLIIVGGVYFLSKSNPPKNYPLPQNLEYFWGNGCPHCANVEQFLNTWDKKDKIKIDKKEVWQNATNATEMQARYEYCKIPATEMRVPLLFTPEGKCFSGDTPIIDYLKSL